MNQQDINEMKTRGESNYTITKKNVIKIYPHFQFKYAEVIIKDTFRFKLVTIDFKKRPRTIDDMLNPDNWKRMSEKAFSIGDLEMELQARL